MVMSNVHSTPSCGVSSGVIGLWCLLLIPLPPHALAQVPVSGSALYDSTCAHCHGADGRGGQLGPSIVVRVAEESDDTLADFIRTGSPERGMPPAPINRQQMPALLEHLRYLAASEAEAGPAAGAGALSLNNRVVEGFRPIDEATLLDPDPGDWLWFSRTADSQRYSPLDQVNRDNVNALTLAWSKGLPNGLSYTIPLVYDGVMYMSTPRSSLVALDATTGDLIWEYRREYENEAMASQDRSKTISMFSDMIYYTAPDSTIVAVDARTGELRWEASAGNRGHSSGSIVVNGMVLSSGNCIRGPRDSCFISAHDAYTGELIWKFNTVQADDEPPGYGTWADVPLEERLASPWGLPGSHDPELDITYWSVANPMPTSRAARHGGDPHATGYSAPADLYSNSTVALDADSGELLWYYQHLPGDDWDLDMNQERILLTTPVNPDPEHVKWINPAITPGEVRKVSVNVGEGGGIWLLDRVSGEFLWANPFPFDVENFFLSDIDVETGRTHINRDLMVDEPGKRRLICYLNTRSFWPSAYHPGENALYVPYIRNCLDMTAAVPASEDSEGRPESRRGAAEPGVDPDELNGLARVDMESGEITHWPMGRIPTTSAILTTAGGLVIWGDLNRRYRAMDVRTGEVLWETILGGPISMSNISYEVDGRQYIAVIAGETLATQTVTRGGFGPIELDLGEPTGNATLYVFALPE